jgi:hypothetical protein
MPQVAARLVRLPDDHKQVKPRHVHGSSAMDDDVSIGLPMC